jgi:hypothetical protein
MKYTTSQAARRSAIAQSVKMQILQLLNITEQDYCLLQFETGICYLSLSFSNKDYESLLLKNRAFWNWWKNQWLLRDELFLWFARYSNILIDQEGRFLIDEAYTGYPSNYTQLHDPVILVQMIRPSKIVLEAIGIKGNVTLGTKSKCDEK